jgi:hypothetical protein
MKDAIKKWLTKANLSTSPYNAKCACNKFLFINKSFMYPGKADLGEHEGGEQGEAGLKEAEDEDRPNTVTTQILLPPSMKPNTGTPEVPMMITALNDHVDRISVATVMTNVFQIN